MSILLKQLTEGNMESLLTKYVKVFGIRNPRVINSVIENCSVNLTNSTSAFIDGLVSLDRDFIESTSTLALQKILLPEIDKLKENKTAFRFKQYQESNLKEGSAHKKLVTISPYVIFGQDMEMRSKLEDPWRYTAPLIGTNRFIAIDPAEGFSLKKIFNQQIFGFNCFVFDKRSIQVFNDGEVKQYKPTNFMVSFETNAENHQFFVSDFNWLVKYHLRPE